jgi:hypothetical protein
MRFHEDCGVNAVQSKSCYGMRPSGSKSVVEMQKSEKTRLIWDLSRGNCFHRTIYGMDELAAKRTGVQHLPVAAVKPASLSPGLNKHG